MNKNMLDKLSALVKHNTRLMKLQDLSEEQFDEQQKIHEQIAEVKGKLQICLGNRVSSCTMKVSYISMHLLYLHA